MALKIREKPKNSVLHHFLMSAIFWEGNEFFNSLICLMVLIDFPAPFLQTSYRGSGKPCKWIVVHVFHHPLGLRHGMDQIFRMRPQNRMKNQHNYCQPIWPVGPPSGSEVLTLPRSPIDYFPKIMEMSQPRGSLSQVREGDVCSQARLARYWRQHPYACSQMLKPFRPFPFNVFLYQTPQPKIRGFAVATLNLLPNSYQICLLE